MKRLNPLDIMLDAVFNYRIFSPVYRNYIDNLGLQGNENVLEFGSGSGAGSRHLAEYLKKGNGRLTCVDTSESWMKLARKRLENCRNIDFLTGEIWNLNLAPSSFDAIVIHFVLHDMKESDREKAINTLVKILKPAGRIFVREPIQEEHGIREDDIRQLMTAGGLQEIQFVELQLSYIGPTYAGVFRLN
jgi:ubiquinone/menaquinone biosynthesis C-methylase UbiE